MSSNPVILYVEDEPSDIVLLQIAFKRAGMPDLLRTVADGMEAIDYLTGNGPYADRQRNPLPALVLLDLNLPRKSGFEVLAWMRGQSHFASLPVIIYTSSTRENDRQAARTMGATDYIVKPSALPQITNLAAELAHRWLPTLETSD